VEILKDNDGILLEKNFKALLRTKTLSGYPNPQIYLIYYPYVI